MSDRKELKLRKKLDSKIQELSKYYNDNPFQGESIYDINKRYEIGQEIKTIREKLKKYE